MCKMFWGNCNRRRSKPKFMSVSGHRYQFLHDILIFPCTNFMKLSLLTNILDIEDHPVPFACIPGWGDRCTLPASFLLLEVSQPWTLGGFQGRHPASSEDCPSWPSRPWTFFYGILYWSEWWMMTQSVPPLPFEALIQTCDGADLLFRSPALVFIFSLRQFVHGTWVYPLPLCLQCVLRSIVQHLSVQLLFQSLGFFLPQS